MILPFGIWGAMAFLWFLAAAGWALHKNFRYGDPALKIVNTGLFSLFIGKVIFFFFVFGALSNDIAVIGAYLGLSFSLNGGICRRPAPVTTEQPAGPQPPAFARPRLQPSFPR